MSTADSLPDDIETLKSMLVAERTARLAAEGEAQHRALLIDKLKYTIRKLRHERFGQSSERGTLLDQLELQLADLEEDAAQAEAAAGMAAASHKITVPSFERRKPARGTCRNTCRASASSIRCRQLVPVVAEGPCARSART